MASWTTPVTHSSGDTLAVTDWNGVANNETFLYQAPYASYYNSSATSMTNNAAIQVTLGGTTTSNYGWSVSSNNAIVPLTGIYWVGAALSWASFATSNSSEGYIYQNGGSVKQDQGAGQVANVVSGVIKATAADTLALFGYQNSGGSINTTALPTSTFLDSYFIGSA